MNSTAVGSLVLGLLYAVFMPPAVRKPEPTNKCNCRDHDDQPRRNRRNNRPQRDQDEHETHYNETEGHDRSRQSR